MNSINDELNEITRYEEDVDALKKGFEKALKINFIHDKLKKEEKELAIRLESNKYSTDKWNLR